VRRYVWEGHFDDLRRMRDHWLFRGFDLRDWLLANDPALSRFRMASRVTLSIVISFVVLFAIHMFIVPLPTAAYGLGIVLSIEAGVAVRDKGNSRQLITRLLGCLASLVVVAIAAGLESYRVASDLVFLVVICLAALARVYGPRGFAIGMFAFTSYFMGAYFHPDIGQLPLIAIGPVVSALTAPVVRAVLLPDDWRRDLLRSLESVQGRVNQILFKLAALAADKKIEESDRQELRHLEERLKEVVLMAESFIPRPAGGVFDEGSDPAAEFAIQLFDLHLAAESAIVLSQQSLPDFALVHAVIECRQRRLAEDEASPDEAAAETRRALLWLGEAKGHLAETILRARTTAFAGMAPADDDPAAAKIDFSFANPLIKSALQITLAAALAMSFGLLLSRERWFWAVLAAFLVFTNTNSRGDTAMRALQRSLGTLLGITIGLGLATLLAGHEEIAIAASVVCIFIAFYFLQTSYATLTFFISIVLCLVYGMMGTLTLNLLALRIEETMIGAVAGTAVAFLLFPARTRGALDAALQKWFDALDALLSATLDGKPRYQLITLSQTLDAAYRDVTVAAKPLGSAWSVVTRPGRIRQTLAIFLSGTYWARIMANSSEQSLAEADRETRKAAISAARKRLPDIASRGSECFFVERKSVTSAARYLPISASGARLGAEMVGGMLARLYPAA
jgi:uncharacterized membrane protein YccC